MQTEMRDNEQPDRHRTGNRFRKTSQAAVPGVAGTAMSALARTRMWFGASTNRRILAATATVAVVSLLVRVASLAKDLAVAYRFGTNDALDAFLIALWLPSLAVNVVASSLNMTFVPIFIELREREGAASADRLFRSAPDAYETVVAPRSRRWPNERMPSSTQAFSLLPT